MVEKEWISCNACGEDNYKEVHRVGEWPVGECLSCGMIYVNPTPFFRPTAEFSELSKEFEYTRYMHNTITPQILEFERNQLQSQLRQMVMFGADASKRLMFLDIGCGSGASVRGAVDLGWEAMGIDIDPELIRTGIEQLDVDLRCSPLLECQLPAESYDYIRMRDVIEHLPNPYAALLEIKRLLIPGGMALFVTPNEDSIPVRTRLLLEGKRDKVATIPPPHHLHGFTPKTMRRILERTGFNLLQMKTTTPVDPVYVTSRNYGSVRHKAYVNLWHSFNWLGKGNFLVSWVQKEL